MPSLEGSSKTPNFRLYLTEQAPKPLAATWLQSAGYRTTLIGKYLNGYPGTDEEHVPPGWDEWYGQISSKGKHASRYYDYALNENGKIVEYGNGEQDYYTDVLARKAKDHVRNASGEAQPFFMYLGVGAPHAPYTPAPQHKNAYIRRQEGAAASLVRRDRR